MQGLKDYSDSVVVKPSKVHGLGVFATKNIPAGAYIIEYIGRKMERATIFQVLTKEQGRYVFNLDEHWSIDGSVPENIAGKINHSCDGNCQIKKVDGHIWIVAKRDIMKGEELGYNYGYRLSGLRDMEKNWRCYCGAPNCIGFILRKKDWPELKRKLAEREEMKRRKLESTTNGKAEQEQGKGCHLSVVS
jgi:SET domain-containing protein